MTAHPVSALDWSKISAARARRAGFNIRLEQSRVKIGARPLWRYDAIRNIRFNQRPKRVFHCHFSERHCAHAGGELGPQLCHSIDRCFVSSIKVSCFSIDSGPSPGSFPDAIWCNCHSSQVARRRSRKQMWRIFHRLCSHRRDWSDHLNTLGEITENTVGKADLEFALG
jgi:hypothetical protein